MAQSRLLNELKSPLLELRTVPSAGRLTHPKVQMRVTKSGPSCPQAVVRPRALPPFPPLFSPLCCLQAACRRSASATLTLRLKFACLRAATRGIQLALLAARWGSLDGYGPKRIATPTRFLLRASFVKKRQ
jgi:hypothetical protein